MSKMDIKQLVALLENEKTWKETNFYKKQLAQENTEIVEDLLNDLNEIIHGKHPPMARLGAVRLLKNCLEAGQEYFNFMVQEGDFLDKLADYTKVKTSTNIFSNKPDKREQQISLTLYTYIVEGFLVWANWFPQSKFSEIFEKLKKAKVPFPDFSKLQIFKADQQHLYVDGIFQKKKTQDPSKPQSSATPGGGATTTTSGKPQAFSQQQIDEKFEEYNTTLDFMIEMLGSMDQATDDLQMFSASFNNFSQFADQLIQSGYQLSDKVQESLLDKSEIALNIHQLIEEFFTQKMSFQDMKTKILEICNLGNRHQQEDNQQQQQQQQMLEQQRQQQQLYQQQQLQEQQRLKQEEEDRQLREKMELERQKEEEDKIRKQKEQEELQRQQLLKEQADQALAQQKALEEQKRRQAEKDQQDKQRELEEQQKKAQLLQSQEDQRQQLRAIQIQKQKEQEEILRKQKEMEEQIQRQKQQEEADEDVRRNKKSQQSRDHYYDDDQEEEERKSQSQKGMSYLNNKQNSQQSRPVSSPMFNQPGQGLYSNQQGNNLQQNNSNIPKRNQQNKEELMTFEVDDDIDHDDNEPTYQYQQQLKQPYPGQFGQSNQISNQQQQPFKPFSQSQSQDQSQGNFPYSSGNTFNKNPFNNNNNQKISNNNNTNNIEPIVQMAAPASNVKGMGGYFAEEEFYEPPAIESQNNRNNNKDISGNNNNKKSKVIFDSNAHLDEDMNEKKGSKISQKQITTQSRLDQSGNIEQDESFQNQHTTQIHRLNNTIAPKSKPQEEPFRPLANPKLQSQINDQQNIVASNASHRNIPSGFEKVSFQQAATLKNQVMSEFTQNSSTQLNQDQQQYVSNNQGREEAPSFSYGRDNLNQGGSQSDLKQNLIDLKREKDITENKLQVENNKLSMRVRELEMSMSQKDDQGSQQIKIFQQKQEELEKRLQEKDRLIFQQKQFAEQQTRELEQARSIAKQAEQQKSEQLQILATKKKTMDEEHQKTRQQLQDYIDSTQKSYFSQLEQLQKRLNQSEVDLSKESAELQQRELENSDLRAELRLLRTKEPGINTGLIRDKDNKIIELKAKIDVLNGEITFREDKIRDLSNENLSFRKAVEDQRSEIATIESQIQISKENVIQRDIEIGQLRQTIFEKESTISMKEQNILALEQTLKKKKEIIEQFKGSAEQQMKKFHESIEESETLTKELQRQKIDLEDRIENIQQQHQADMNRIIQASKLTEDEKNIYKQLIEESEKLKADSQGAVLREQNLQAQITQLQRSITCLKKENEQQERNLEDLVAANNLITKQLYERDEQFAKDHEQMQREIELTEKKYAAELKYTRQAVDTLKIEKQRKENDLGRSMDTLRKENELLLSNLKTKAFLSPSMTATRAQIFSPMVKFELDGNEIDRLANSSNNNNFNSLQNSNINNQIQDRQYETVPAGMQSKQPVNSFNPILANTLMSPQQNGYDARIGDEFNSNNKNDNNNGSLNASTYSIKPRRVVPKNYLGRETPFNNAYFAYLQADKNQMYRFKKACLKNKMAIYQDSYLNVGIITETKEIDGKIFLLLSVFFENKSLTAPLQSVQISYSGDDSIGVYKKPATLPDYFKENAQHSQQIITEFNDVPYKIIQCSISYTFNGKANQATFPLPNSINKFFSPVPQATLSTISASFSDFQHLVLCSEEIQVDKNIASSQYDYTNYFDGFLNFGNVDGLPDYQCIAGQYFVKNINTNIWLKVNYNKKDHKVIFQVVYDNQLEEYSQATAKYLLQILILIFKQ